MQPAQMNPAAQPKVQWTPHQFLKATKPLRAKLIAQQAFAEATDITFQLNQAGLLNLLYFKLEFDLTIAGTVTSGKWATLPTPAPWGIITRVQFYNNNSYILRDLDGWTWYSWVRDRYGFDITSANPGIVWSGDVNARLGNNNASTPIANANIAAGTFHISIALPMPIAYNRSGDTGLIVLPTPGVYYYLKISIGTIISTLSATGGSSSLINTLVGTGLTYAIANVNLKVEQEYFMIPMGSQGLLQNFVSLFMAVTRQVIPTLNAGQNIYIPPPNDFYTFVSVELVNAAGHIASTNVTNIQWQYGGQTIDYIDDMDMIYVVETFNNRQIPMEGKMVWDLGTRLGNLSKRDTYDAFNAQQVTGLQLQWTIASTVTITAPSQGNVILESLRPIGQPG